MTAPTYNVGRLERLVNDLDAARAGLMGKQSLLQEYDDEARRLFGALVNLWDVPAGLSLPDLCTQLRGMQEDPGAPLGELHTKSAARLYRLRDALAAAERARLAKDRATALRADLAAESAELAPLAVLVKNCRAWAGLNGYSGVTQ